MDDSEVEELTNYNGENIIIERILEDGTKFELIIHKGKPYLTMETAGILLGYDDPTKRVWGLFDSHKEVLEKYTLLLKLRSSSRGRKTQRLLGKTAFTGICFFSESPNAVPRQKEVLKIMEEYDTKGIVIKPDYVSPLDKYSDDDLLYEMMRRQQGRLQLVEKKVEKVETKTTEVIETVKRIELQLGLNKTQKYELKAITQSIVERLYPLYDDQFTEGQFRALIWGFHNYWFKVHEYGAVHPNRFEEAKRLLKAVEFLLERSTDIIVNKKIRKKSFLAACEEYGLPLT